MATRTIANLGVGDGNLDTSLELATSYDQYFQSVADMLGAGAFVRSSIKDSTLGPWSSTSFAKADTIAKKMADNSLKFLPNVHFAKTPAQGGGYRLPTDLGGTWQQWNDYITAVCDRFAPTGTLDVAYGPWAGLTAIEGWNEPNTPTGRATSTGVMAYSDCYQLTTRFCSVIRGHAKMGGVTLIGLCLGGLNAWSYLTGLMDFVDTQETGATRTARLTAFWNRMDAMGIHIYQGSRPVDAPGSTTGTIGTIKGLGTLRAWLNNNGGTNLRLWMTEGGISGQDPVPFRGGTDRLPNKYHLAYKTGATTGTVSTTSKAGSSIVWEGPNSVGKGAGDDDQATYFNAMFQIANDGNNLTPSWGIDGFIPFFFMDDEPAWTSAGDQYPYWQHSRGFINTGTGTPLPRANWKPVAQTYHDIFNGTTTVNVPAPQITSSPTNPTTSTSASFSFTDTLAGATFEVALDGSAYTASTSPKAYSGLATGDHVFAVRAISSGTPSQATSFSWTIQTTATPPASPTVTSGPASGIATSGTFVFSSVTPSVTYQGRIRNTSSADPAPGFTTVASPYSASNFPLGSLVFEVRAVDGSGQVSPLASWSWTVRSPLDTSTSTKITYKVEVVWTGRLQHVFTLGSSTLDGTDPITGGFGTGTYTDITADVKSITTNRGKSSKYDQVQPGECVIELKDTTRKYDPENTAGPLYGLLVPLRPMRVSAVYQGQTFPLYQGWTRRLRAQPKSDSYSATLECSDTFIRLDDTLARPIITPRVNITVGQAIGLILDSLGLTEPSGRDLDDGSTIKNFSADGTVGAASLISGLLAMDGGTFYISNAGTATYDDAKALSISGAQSSVNTTIDTQPGFDLEGIVNRVIANQSDNPAWNQGNPLVVQDDTSIGLYGQRELQVDSPYWTGESQATTFAGRVIRDQATPLRPVSNVRLSNAPDPDGGDTTRRALLERDLNELVDLPTIGVTAIIQSITHEISDGGQVHFCTWGLTQAPRSIIQPFILGTSSLDGDDQIV